MDFKQGGKALQRIRKERGLTQETLGEMAGASAVTVSRIERGVFTPSLPTLISLCNALSVCSRRLPYPMDTARSTVGRVRFRKEGQGGGDD